jgi:hypothetical protein
MKHVIWKIYANYEKEEKWINEMAAQGLALTGYSWCRYQFEETSRGEYSYRIELLDEMACHPQSVAYLRFMEEMGVECAATYMRWVYLRKKTADGPFELYSDIDSKIKHFTKIQTFWRLLGFAELVIGISNLSSGLAYISDHQQFDSFHIIAGSFLAIIGVLFLSLAWPLTKKIKKLRQEKIITE